MLEISRVCTPQKFVYIIVQSKHARPHEFSICTVLSVCVYFLSVTLFEAGLSLWARPQSDLSDQNWVIDISVPSFCVWKQSPVMLPLDGSSASRWPFDTNERIAKLYYIVLCVYAIVEGLVCTCKTQWVGQHPDLRSTTLCHHLYE